MKIKRIFVVILLVLLMFSCGKKKSKEMPIKAKEHTVGRSTVSKKILQSGTVQPKKVVSVMSNISGKAAKFLIKEGVHLKKGAEVVYVYPDINDIQRVNQIKRNYAISQKNYKTTKNK